MRALVLVTLAACGFDGASTTDPDAPRPDGTPDDSVLADAAVDAPGCLAISGGVPSELAIPRVVPPTIDGNLEDWTTCFLQLDESTAGLVRRLDLSAPIPAGRFSVAHDGENLYVAAIVEGIVPLGNATVDIYRNDSIALYVDPDGQMATPGYDQAASQIVVDHASRRHAYRQANPIGVPSMSAGVTVNAQFYTVEILVTPATYGVNAFAETIGFDLAIDGGDGNVQENEILWTQRCGRDSGCPCPNGDDAPYCSAQQFGYAHLVP